MNELGIGFLESVYKNALFFALREKGLFVEAEKSFEAYFKRQKVDFYKSDLVVVNLVVVEIKCCKKPITRASSTGYQLSCGLKLTYRIISQF